MADGSSCLHTCAQGKDIIHASALFILVLFYLLHVNPLEQGMPFYSFFHGIIAMLQQRLVSQNHLQSIRCNLE
jgi:hypothetical protein